MPEELKKCCTECGVFLYRFYTRKDGKYTPAGWYCPICYHMWWDKDLAKDVGES